MSCSSIYFCVTLCFSLLTLVNNKAVLPTDYRTNIFLPTELYIRSYSSAVSLTVIRAFSSHAGFSKSYFSLNINQWDPEKHTHFSGLLSLSSFIITVKTPTISGRPTPHLMLCWYDALSNRSRFPSGDDWLPQTCETEQYILHLRQNEDTERDPILSDPVHKSSVMPLLLWTPSASHFFSCLCVCQEWTWSLCTRWRPNAHPPCCLTWGSWSAAGAMSINKMMTESRWWENTSVPKCVTDRWTLNIAQSVMCTEWFESEGFWPNGTSHVTCVSVFAATHRQCQRL